MRSGTSFFNSTLYRKNMARFWPIWAVYTLIWAFLMPLQFLTLPARYIGASDDLAYWLMRQANIIPQLLTGGNFIAFGAGVVCAMAVFSYLYSARSACMMHALPMDRKSLFFTNYLSGLSFLLLPNAAIFLSTLAVELLFGCVNLPALVSWLAVQSGLCFFYYSFAAFCAMFTGNLLALPAFYGILSFLVMVMATLVSNVLDLFFYGFAGLSGKVEQAVMWFAPLIHLNSALSTHRVETLPDGSVMTQVSHKISQPEVLAIYVVVAVVLTVLALMVYRRRHVESAGDVVAIAIVRPVFRFGVAVCAGLSLGIATVAILGFPNTELALGVFMAVWSVIGYFVAEMLLRKSFRVFKAWKGAVAIAAVMALLFVAVDKDWFGYENRIPAANEVESIYVSSLSLGAPYDDAHRVSDLTLKNEKQIQEVMALHQAIIHEKDREDHGNDYISLCVDYTLKNGATLSRRYYSVPAYLGETEAVDSVTRAAYALTQDRELVRQAYKFDGIDDTWRLADAYLENVVTVNPLDLTENWMYDTVYLDGAAGEDLERLWQAMLADFEDGHLGVRYLFDSSDARMDNTYTTDLVFQFEKPVKQGSSIQLNLDPNSRTETMPTATAEVYYDSVKAVEMYQNNIRVTLTPQAERTLAWLEDMANFDTGRLFTHRELNALEEARSELEKELYD